jgi:hypothetical protein
MSEKLQTKTEQKKLKTKPKQKYNNRRKRGHHGRLRKILIAEMLQQQQHIANSKIKTSLKEQN